MDKTEPKQKPSTLMVSFMKYPNYIEWFSILKY